MIPVVPGGRVHRGDVGHPDLDKKGAKLVFKTSTESRLRAAIPARLTESGPRSTGRS
ncbi:hypothetical protein ACWEQ7_09370 [Streptomyces sp. NPDC004069]|uniref:hypothetical protein n=1 Tax=Streptomyces sp. NPDC052043 TaxID=3365684 RepID=UPI0037D718CF